jgi:hypothetical protein
MKTIDDWIWRLRGNERLTGDEKRRLLRWLVATRNVCREVKKSLKERKNVRNKSLVDMLDQVCVDEVLRNFVR